MINILIADDEPIEREMLTEMLEKRFGSGVTIRQARNGREAVDVASFWDADVLLMDIEMPGLTGMEAAAQILQHRPGCKVIFVTAYGLFSYAQEAVKLGACDYLLKPVDPEELENAIRRAIRQAESHRQLEAAAPEAGELELGTAYDKTTVLISRVKQYLQHNYVRFDLSLESVSGILNINASYFSSLFKRSVGVNFVDYLTDIRMNAAKELLTDPLRSTQEVAGMVGYESANYFTRAFKKKTGMTPTEYRRQRAREREVV